MVRVASTGSLPKAANMIPPAIIVSTTASTGVAHAQVRLGEGRFSNLSTLHPHLRLQSTNKFLRRNLQFSSKKIALHAP